MDQREQGCATQVGLYSHQGRQHTENYGEGVIVLGCLPACLPQTLTNLQVFKQLRYWGFYCVCYARSEQLVVILPCDCT